MALPVPKKVLGAVRGGGLRDLLFRDKIANCPGFVGPMVSIITAQLGTVVGKPLQTTQNKKLRFSKTGLSRGCPDIYSLPLLGIDYSIMT